MDWQAFWNNTAKAKSSIDQVQRKDMESTLLTTQHIIDVLEIDKNDVVVDVCCGNGLITKEVAKHCKHITGIDISEDLLQHALEHASSENTSYCFSSAEEFSKMIETKADKIYLEFSFQYFENFKQGKQVIMEMLNALNDDGKILIGDVPDRSKLWKFYNTFDERFFYLSKKISKKKGMGKFWKQKNLFKICKALGVKGEVLVQDEALPYAHYRFDFLITKQIE